MKNKFIENAIKDLQKLISIPGIVCEPENSYPYGYGVECVKNFLLGICREFGFKVVDRNGYAFAEIGNGSEIIGILGHIDVVPAGDGWSVDPFGGEILDGKLYGRGAIDDKGPVVAVIYAMKSLLDKGDPSKRIRLILGQTEENGEWTDIDRYIEFEDIPDYGFTPDGDFPAIYYESGAMVLKLRMPVADSGVEYFSAGSAPNMVPDNAEIVYAGKRFTATGETAHGCAPWLGINAITNLVGQMDGIEDIPVLKMYDELFGSKIYGEGINCKCIDDDGAKLTVNIGRVETVGDEIIIYADIRFPRITDASILEAAVREHLRAYNVVTECIYQTDPIYLDVNGKVMTSLLSAYRDITGDTSPPISIGGGTYAKAMKNIVAFGPNFPEHENREHKANEYILLSDFECLIDIYEKALENLINMK